MIPTALHVVAVMQLLSGLTALVDMILQLGHAEIALNLGVLGIPVYFGLLKLNDGWRSCAIAFAVFGMGTAVMMFGLGIAAADLAGEVQIMGIPVTVVSPELLPIVAVPLFLLFAWQYRVLTRPDVSALFLEPVPNL